MPAFIFECFSKDVMSVCLKKDPQHAYHQFLFYFAQLSNTAKSNFFNNPFFNILDLINTAIGLPELDSLLPTTSLTLGATAPPVRFDRLPSEERDDLSDIFFLAPASPRPSTP